MRFGTNRGPACATVIDASEHVLAWPVVLRYFAQTTANACSCSPAIVPSRTRLRSIPHPYPHGMAEAWIAGTHAERARAAQYAYAITRADGWPADRRDRAAPGRRSSTRTSATGSAANTGAMAMRPRRRVPWSRSRSGASIASRSPPRIWSATRRRGACWKNAASRSLRRETRDHRGRDRGVLRARHYPRRVGERGARRLIADP